MKPSTLGENVLIYRRRAGLTQSELGEKTGIDKGTISRLERGYIQDVSTQTLLYLAYALGMSTDALLGRRQHQPHAHRD
jgi:transcriptional regulator with XRE-family HTH domain